MNKIRKSVWSKALSIFMTLTFLTFMFAPTNLYALSSGPGQPELEGFAPIGADNMVDLFTGDFSYNIPLLNVPGPDGGYPINLSYSAGIDMEQEASWVGLGWSLNPGAINREVRGLPDDFNGEEITKELSQKPSKTIIANIPLKNIEVYGADVSKIKKKVGDVSSNINLIYDNYTGFDVKPGIGFSFVKEQKEKSTPVFASPIFSFSKTENGEFNFSYPFSDIIKKNSRDFEKEYFSNLISDQTSYLKRLTTRALNIGNTGFSGSPQVSNINLDYPRKTTSSRYNAKVGGVWWGKTADIEVDVLLNTQKVEKPSLNLNAYGYMYSEKNYENNEGKGLMDLTTSNNSVITPDSRVIPVPIQTHDIFHIKAQGLGGIVRAHKGGLTHLSDPNMLVENHGFGADVEANFTLPLVTEIKLGAGGDYTYSSIYSGDWQNAAGHFDVIKGDLYKDHARKKHPRMEPYYFRFKGEMTAETNQSSLINDERAASLELTTGFYGYSQLPKATSTIMYKDGETGNIGSHNIYKKERTKRVKSFQVYKESEVSSIYPFAREVRNIITSTPTTDDYDPVSYTNSDKIGTIEITNENGGRYIYGIPAKNNSHIEATFSVSAKNLSTIGSVSKLVDYKQSENSTSNESGNDNYYSSTSTPEHAHSWLLTEVVSPDYVDVSGNGPSKDDLGNYTSFNYGYIPNFSSISPSPKPSELKGNYLPAQFSNKGDDKATISYYEKDLYFLETIKTKTHVAVFETEVRDDGRGVISKSNTNFSSDQLRKLKKITLYNIDNYEKLGNEATPIKTVNFSYNEELCDGVYNSSSGNGKLTLKEVYYTVGDENTKMTLSPYAFEYGFNPDYEPENKDRWGSFQTAAQNKFGSNVLYPYSSASGDDANQNAEAWNLTEITLPTGGKINITYEADRYKYVQNREAQNMYQLLGFSDGSETQYESDLEKENQWLIVQLSESISTSEVSSFTSNIDNIWFKAFVKYKDFEYTSSTPDGSSLFNNNDNAYDFVQGYLTPSSESPKLFDPDGEGYSDKIMIKVEKIKDIHPIRTAAIVDMKLNRTYLTDDSGLALDGLLGLGQKALGFISTFVSKAFDFATDDPFVTKALANSWCSSIGGEFSSIVRLNAVNDKIGGGHRVKRIEISDGWTNMGGHTDQSQTYGQEYFYELEDGTSSGVAQYEPLSGGEENPFREPIPYSSEQLLFNDKYLFTEMPVAETLFPSPLVGYSRVLVKNIANESATINGAGIQEHRFYTAKEFPIKVEKSKMDMVNHVDIDKVLKFLGSKDYFQPGFSQGFLVETNDMHGKQRASATYSAGSNLSKDSPQQKVEYFYKTKDGFSDNKSNQLDNSTTVFYGDGYSKTENIGVEKDAWIYFKESQNLTTTGGLKVNGSFYQAISVWLVGPITAFANIDYNYGLSRTVSITKTINRTAILEKVIATQDGAEVITENLGFDAEIGAPILTSVTNEYGDKTYDYRQPAHWHYPQAQGAYQNSGLEIIGDPSNYKAYLQNGDVLLKNGDLYWITDLDNETLVDENENSVDWEATLQGAKVVRSGYRNQQALQVGAIQTMTNPIHDNGFDLSLLNEYNSNIPYSFTGQSGSTHTVNFNDCEHGALSTDIRLFQAEVSLLDGNVDVASYYEQVIASMIGTEDIYILEVQLAPANCNGTPDIIELIFPLNDDTQGKFNQMEIKYLGKGIVVAIDGETEVNGIVSGIRNGYGFVPNALDCYGKCLDGVLNASATTLSDELKSEKELPTGVTQNMIDDNPYRYGYRGLLKTKSQMFYPQDRLQTNINGASRQTDITLDGEYDEFFGFKWQGSNPSWKTATEVSKYDYNGNPVEEKDAIGNYSAVIFGYERTLPTAVAGNAEYLNMAFDGFEDYPLDINSPYDPQYQEVNSHHLYFNSNVSLSEQKTAHTGKYSIKVNGSAEADLNLDNNLNNYRFASGEYVVYAWHRVGDDGALKYSDDGGTTVISTAEVISTNIEGWELLRLYFTANGSSDALILSGTNAHFDDIRIQPFNSSMKCFVYDRGTQKTVAVLDENHFATLYNYDRDQVLVQVKKETERGIKTIQSTQRHTHINTTSAQ